MRIKMLKTAAGPQGVWYAGSTAEVDDKLGGELVRVGAAEMDVTDEGGGIEAQGGGGDEETAPEASVEQPESAVLEVPEHAVLKRPRGRKGGP